MTPEEYDEVVALVWQELPTFVEDWPPLGRRACATLVRNRLAHVVQRGPHVAVMPASLEEQLDRMGRAWARSKVVIEGGQGEVPADA
jgi:hypothetical protein